MKNVVGLIIFLASFSLVSSVELTILHTNDVHARFEQYNLRSRPCEKDDFNSKHCFGGAARRQTVLKRLRSQNKNVLLLDAGDQYQGTVWYTALKWPPIAAYMNLMNYTAMAFGNHEFDDGSDDGLQPFVQKITFPVVNSNIETDNVQFKSLYKKYYELEIDGQRIAIIGYTTTDTPALSRSASYLKFNDEIPSLKKVVGELQSKGVNKIIAIGHSGIEMDRKICQEVAGVDVVVGGHTNTFLYTGNPPSTEEKEGPYPEVYTTTGANCLVVQDYAFGKYLGFLQVSFDDASGIVKKWNGNPILLNNNEPEDSDMLALLQPYKNELETFKKTIIGTTAVGLDGKTESCRLKECNLGNMVADALLYHYTQHEWAMNPNQKQWATMAVALINGGGIREFQAEPMTNLTLEDLYTFLPFGNTIELIKIKGKYILEAFEHSVEDYSVVTKEGRFLQVSGVKVVYDLSKPNGQRVKTVLIRCANCPIPVYDPLRPDDVYDVVTVSYVRDGGDGYSMIRDNVIRADSADILDADAVMNYVKKFQPIQTGVEGRISFCTDSIFNLFFGNCNSAACPIYSSFSVSISLLCFSVIKFLA